MEAVSNHKIVAVLSERLGGPLSFSPMRCGELALLAHSNKQHSQLVVRRVLICSRLTLNHFSHSPRASTLLSLLMNEVEQSSAVAVVLKHCADQTSHLRRAQVRLVHLARHDKTRRTKQARRNGCHVVDVVSGVAAVVGGSDRGVERRWWSWRGVAVVVGGEVVGTVAAAAGRRRW